MRVHILAGVALATSVLIMTPALAGSSKTGHGVRIHKLMEPQEQEPETAPTASHIDNAVAPHKHRIVLRRGQRVVVRIFDGFGRSKYRKQHPGVNRPWQDRRYGSNNRRYLNPKGLYTSKLYRRGYN